MHPSPQPLPVDSFDRPLRSLRVSVTDRCNLRCTYCMPETDYEWLPRADILDFGEVRRVVESFVALGVDRVRLTGGEPLLRKDLPELVRRIALIDGLREVALTTNAVRLPELGPALRDAGLSRITISIDTLRPDRFRKLTGRDVFDRAVAGIRAAADLGLPGLKLNTVVMRGTNDDEICDLLKFAREHGAEPRFIEYMDVGGATRWQRDQVVSRDQILQIVAREFGSARPVDTPAAAPASRFELADGTRFGIIASTTQPFCADCDRVRITADGTLLTCLYARTGVDLRCMVRSDLTDDELRERIAAVWRGRADRGAEQRLALAQRRGVLVEADELKQDPHLEMHTRGG